MVISQSELVKGNFGARPTKYRRRRDAVGQPDEMNMRTGTDFVKTLKGKMA